MLRVGDPSCEGCATVRKAGRWTVGLFRGQGMHAFLGMVSSVHSVPSVSVLLTYRKILVD